MVLSSAIVCDHDRRIADDRRPYCDLGSAIRDNMETSLYVLSSAIVCDRDRRIADNRRSMFPYDRRRSQTLLRSAIIWKPALSVILSAFARCKQCCNLLLLHAFVYLLS